MNYEALFKAAKEKTIRSAIMGAGEFGTSFIFQAVNISGLEVPAVCNRTVEKGVNAYTNAGIPKENIRICESEAEAKKALEAGKYVVVGDGMLLMNLPIDVLVEGTGNPEVGARYAEAAIQHGMNVAMVTKEADSVVGPILFEKARQSGLVYTTVEGDQPSLLIGLITWGRVLGLNIICAGKSSEYDFVLDSESSTVTCQEKVVSAPSLNELWHLNDRSAEEIFQKRSKLLAELPQHAVPDLCEMCVVTNATGIKPASPTLNAPISRTIEIPDFLCTKNQGDILEKQGVVDVINCLRRSDEASMSGGVFIVVECKDQLTWKVLGGKGHPVSRNGHCALIYHPPHLLGVEAPISVLSAALLNHATGGETLTPVCDVVGKTTKNLTAGTELKAVGHHHTIDGVSAMMVDAVKARDENPVPYYMLDNARLRNDVPEGDIITCKMVHPSQDSALWRLRTEQDTFFV